MSKAKRVALYLRVSTKGQTVENQRRELEAVAERSGWRVVAVYEDAGISGAKGRPKRQGFDRLLKDATRRQFDLIAAWSVDRLGQSLQDLDATLNEVHSLGSKWPPSITALKWTVTTHRDTLVSWLAASFSSPPAPSGSY